MITTASIVEINIDCYGQNARVSALADFLEIAALKGVRVTRAALQDIIVDNEWVTRPQRRFHLPDEITEDPESWSDAAYRMISDRSNQIGEPYPFEERGKALKLKDPSFDPLESCYISLLAITAVHAWNIQCETAAESVLEDIVARTLDAMGLSSANIGATDRGTGFLSALSSGASALGLRAHPNPTPRSVAAKDVGVDTLAGIVWRDNRVAGQWLMLGQVTVAQSQYWAQKLNQPEPARWADFLQEHLHPQVFLAVPHHVQDDHLRDLMASRRGLIIDRLRLVAKKPRNSTDEKVVIQALLDAHVDGV